MTASLPAWDWVPSPHCRSPRRSSVTGVVQHYTGGGNGRALARWLAGPDARVSAHILICRDGQVIQQVEFENEAWHAGEEAAKGFWKGLPQPENVNRFTIGIENSNYGWLLRNDHKFYIPKKTATGYKPGRLYKGPWPVMARDHNGKLRFWEPYPESLIKANIEVLKRIVELYPSIQREDIQSHSSVSPHRKYDPGPLFPWEHILSAVFREPAKSGFMVYGQGEDPQDRTVDPREYYDEDLGMCIDPALKSLP